MEQDFPLTASQKEIEVRVKTWPHFEGLALPEYKTQGSSGFDLLAACQDPVVLKPGARALIPGGISISLPQGFEAQVRPRSGLAIQHGITLLNTPGTIDSDYRGEIKVILINLGQEPFTVTRGMRIAQVIIAEVIKARLIPADNLDATHRGNGGFGHTGI
ncbi:MAG: dUTP diphosphatase [Candidatus Omnitrophica bacterium]|nr:dUTP diphosphatase [Candidatus Omnitrophota bacterium]MDD5671745.1 dUTP diphosphatase [Candidatus Omnitrophota bacterium]